jgi:hypothetical protein
MCVPACLSASLFVCYVATFEHYGGAAGVYNARTMPFSNNRKPLIDYAVFKNYFLLRAWQHGRDYLGIDRFIAH